MYFLSNTNFKTTMSDSTTNMATFKAVAQGSGWPTKVQISDTQWTIQVDEVEEDGGLDSGPNPMQYFAAALAACQNEQAQVVAEEMNLDIGPITINLEIDLDLSGFMGVDSHSNGSYKAVRFTAKVAGTANNGQLKSLGEKVNARCPIMALLSTSGCSIDSSWEAA